MAKINVGVNGYGTIGKRVVDAILAQDDMALTGVAKIRPDISSSLLLSKGIDVYAATDTAFEAMRKTGLKVSGMLSDMINKSDVIIDCTPEGNGAKNKTAYESAGKKAVFQGGEKSDVAECSFVSEINYDSAKGKRFVRVVSCNTTGLCRTLGRLDKDFGVKKARVTIVRRGADPNEIKKGPINSLVPNPASLPSHHAKDVLTVIPDIKIFSSAIIAPTTLMHVHAINVELDKAASKEDIISSFSGSKRIRLVDASAGIDSTAAIMDLARDLGRRRGDMPEATVWKDSIFVEGDELYYLQAVHQESIVVPENIDAIRAMFGLAQKEESIEKTNRSLGIQ